MNTQAWADLAFKCWDKPWCSVKPFSEDLLSTYHAPGTVLGARDAFVNKTPCLHVAYSLEILVNLIPRTKKKKRESSVCNVVSSLIFSQNHI